MRLVAVLAKTPTARLQLPRRIKAGGIVLATNTSSFLLSEICENLPSRNRMVGIHYVIDAGHNVCGADLQRIPPGNFPANNARFLAVEADVAKEADCRDAVAQAIDAFGQLDGLIHMAAIHSTLTWQELTVEHFTRVLAVNVTGSFLIASASARHMKKGGA